MAKMNFTKAEKAFDNAIQKLAIDNLSDLASIASAIQDPTLTVKSPKIKEVIERFHKELKKLKKSDPKIYEKLHLSPEDEIRFSISPEEFEQIDWLRLKSLKEKIDLLKKELYGDEVLDNENEKQVLKERKRHINKRHNIREGWVPLD
jgi:hypothetical protein